MNVAIAQVGMAGLIPVDMLVLVMKTLVGQGKYFEVYSL